MGMTHDPRLEDEPSAASSSLRDVITFLGAFGGVTFLILLLLSLVGATELSKTSTTAPLIVSGIAVLVWGVSSYERVKARLSVRSSSYMLVAGAQLVVVLAILTGVSVMLHQNPKRWDLTESGVHTLSSRSLQVVQQVKAPVHILAFFEEGTAEAESIRRTASMYVQASPHITFALKSPAADIADVQKYKVIEKGPRVIVETDVLKDGTKRDARFKMTAADLDIEERLTNALIYATQKQRPMVGVLLGHSERSLLSKGDDGLTDLKTDLLAEGYEVVPLNLRSARQVPDNVSVVVIAGARKELLPPEVEALTTYLRQGGRLLLLLEPGGAQHAGLLGPYGVLPNADLILDVSKFGRMFGSGPDTATVSDYGTHPITADFNNATTLFQRSQSLSLLPSDAQVVPLAFTHEDTWGETDVASIQDGTAKWDSGEGNGPLTLAVAIHVPLDGKDKGEGKGQDKDKGNGDDVKDPSRRSDETRLVVVGDSSFVTNSFRRMGGNRDLMLNMTAWLSSNDERISVRSNRRGTSLIVLTETQRNGVVLTLVVLFPSLLFALGFTVWQRRRSR